MDIDNIVLSVISNFVAAVIGFFAKGIFTNRKRLKLLCASKIHKNDQIRISCAYLFRIKIKGEYLLIQGNRIKSQYQPVGGVYAYFQSAQQLFNELKAYSDSSLNTTKSDPNDLRLCIPRKNLLRFLDWFDSRKGREVETLREFREELIEPGYLPDSTLRNFNPEFICNSERKITYSKELETYELLIHDVYEIRLSDEEIQYITDQIRSNGESKIILANERDIKRGSCMINENAYYTIAPTARKIL